MNLSVQHLPGRDDILSVSLRPGEPISLCLQIFPAADTGCCGEPLRIAGYRFAAEFDFPARLDASTEDGGIQVADADRGCIQIRAETPTGVPAAAYPFRVWAYPPSTPRFLVQSGRIVVKEASSW